jgi:hypothetical protein
MNVLIHNYSITKLTISWGDKHPTLVADMYKTRSDYIRTYELLPVSAYSYFHCLEGQVVKKNKINEDHIY